MKSIGIRYRLILTICLFITLILSVIATGTYAYFRHTTQQLILRQQFDTITTLAGGLDNNIVTAHDALINVAKVASPGIVSNQRVAQEWLNNRTGIRTIFKHSLIILDKNGDLIASLPETPGMYGTSFAHREYFTRTMSSRKPYISAPFVTVFNDHPVVMMTSIIQAEDGSIKGLLCGSIDLLEPDGLFETVKNLRLGSSGYLYLFAPDRTMVIHPDMSRIMKKDVLPGANIFFDKALDGFEGSGATVNSRGISFLSSFKRLQTTGWILAANYPATEAFEPITRFRNYFLAGMICLLLGAFALAWKLGDNFSRPIEKIIMRLDSLAKPGSDRRQRLDTGRSDEFGVLAASFNALLDEILQGEKKLKKTQMNLYQSEKLASVGQLAAGVAHEINNPIAFINSNLGALKGQVKDLLSVIAAYEQAESVFTEHPQKMATISAAKLAADLDYLRSDIENLIAESLEGARRVKAIVDNLRDFSNLDSAEWQSANLESGLDSTLAMLCNEIKDKAQIVRDYAGLPEIECIAVQINQVFMNLLVNAAQAIADRGTITLRTGFDASQVWVEVEDTGGGITPEHLNKIFEPFFTTRPVGKGTGLGLSLAYGIVKQHHGHFDVRSEPGKGSVFRVTLPRQRVAKDGSS